LTGRQDLQRDAMLANSFVGLPRARINVSASSGGRSASARPKNTLALLASPLERLATGIRQLW
jgi:hypothetical protein